MDEQRADSRAPFVDPGNAEDDSHRAGPRERAGSRVRVALFFVGAVLVTNALIGDRGLVQVLRARAEYAKLSHGIATLRHENRLLREEARRLREDRRAIEEIARRELGLIKPGEILFIIKDRTMVPPATAPEPAAGESRGPAASGIR